VVASTALLKYFSGSGLFTPKGVLAWYFSQVPSNRATLLCRRRAIHLFIREAPSVFSSVRYIAAVSREAIILSATRFLGSLGSYSSGDSVPNSEVNHWISP